MVIAAFRFYRIAICIRLHCSRGSVTAGNRLILYQDAVCLGLVFYILAIRIGFQLKLPADLLAVFVVLVYRLITFLVFLYLLFNVSNSLFCFCNNRFSLFNFCANSCHC